MPICPGCGAENQSNDSFCVVCGHRLSLAPKQPPVSDPPTPGGDLLEAGIVCPNCDTYNEPTRRNCVNCGKEFSGVTSLLRSIDAAPPPTLQVQREPQPPPQPPLQPIDSAPPPTLQVQREPQPPLQPPPQPPTSKPVSRPRTFVSNSMLSSMRLRLLRGFGRRAEEIFPINAPRLTLGRSGATIVIPDDLFLAPVHLVLLLDQGRLLVEDPGSANGVFLRIRDQVELRPGAEIIIGSQRMLLLGLGGATTDLRTPQSKDTRAYGSPIPRQLFLALRLLHNDPQVRARAGAVILRSGPTVSIGQKDCSINFPDDPRLALHHIDLHLNPASIIAVDIGSAGVFARMRSTSALQNGDEFMIGDELFRVEIE